MTQRERYIKLLAAEADRHCAMAQLATEPALKNDQLDVSLACWAGVAALEREVMVCGSAKKGLLSLRRGLRRCLARIRSRNGRIPVK